jgi:N-acetylneuraminate epimerase
MKSLIISFLVMVMLSPNIAVAQKKQIDSIQWRIAAQLRAGSGQASALGLAGPVSGVHENVLMVGGGANFPDSMPWLGGKKKYYDELYVFKKETSIITLHPKKFKLPFPIAYAAVCSTPQGVVYAGGENDYGISNQVVLLQWDSISEAIIIKNLPTLPIAVTNAAATINGNSLYIAGGETANGVVDQFCMLDLNNINHGWKQLPPIPKPVSHTVSVVQSNGTSKSIYLIGGRKKNTNGISDLYASVYEYDLSRNNWKEKQSLPYALSAGTGIAPGDHNVWILGGDKGTIFHKAEIMIAAINSEKDEVKKQALIKEKNKLQATHPGFSKEVLRYNTLTNSWVKAGIIPFEAPVTTTACMWGGEVIIAAGEIRAGVRTPNIISGKFR